MEKKQAPKKATRKAPKKAPSKKPKKTAKPVAPPTKKQAIQPGWMNKKTMAASLKMTLPGFERWGVEPAGKIGREVFFTVADVVANRENKLLGKYQNTPTAKGNLNLEVESARLKSEQADAAELKNEITRRETAPVALITLALARVSAQCSAILGGVKLKAKRAAPHLKASDLEAIDKEVAKLMDRD